MEGHTDDKHDYPTSTAELLQLLKAFLIEGLQALQVPSQELEALAASAKDPFTLYAAPPQRTVSFFTHILNCDAYHH